MHIGETIELTASVTGRISINQFIDAERTVNTYRFAYVRFVRVLFK